MIEGVAKIATGDPIFQTFQETLQDLKILYIHVLFVPNCLFKRVWNSRSLTATPLINNERSQWLSVSTMCGVYGLRSTVYGLTSIGHIPSVEQGKRDVLITVI